MGAWQQPAFRANQVYTWIYKSLVDDLNDMRNLPRPLLDLLAERASLVRLDVVRSLVTEDRLSEKALFRTEDGQLFETVLMRYPTRNSVCLSSQIGCALGCALCATGKSGYIRDLSAGELVAQLLHFERLLHKQGTRITNVVLMGMGEPLLNLEAVLQMLSIVTDPSGLALGARRFTISTAGVVPGIERLADEDTGVRLAISLHAPEDELRSRLIPLNRRYPLGRLIPAAKRFAERTGRRVTFEYAMAAGVNDSLSLAYRTVELLSGLYCHVNLIPLYETAGCDYKPSDMTAVLAFQQVLQDARIRTTIRMRRGEDIAAGCGQLRGLELEDDDEQ